MTPRVGSLSHRELVANTLQGAKSTLRRSLLPLCALALSGGVAAGAGLLYRFALTSPHFSIHTVEMSPVHQASPSTLLARMKIGPDTNIFTVDLAALERALKSEPWIKTASVRRRLPDRLEVTLTERSAAALVVMGGLYLADENGAIFKRAAATEGADLPVITGIERDEYDSDPAATKARIVSALSAHQAFMKSPARDIGLSEVRVDLDSNITLYTWQGGIAIRLGSDRIPEKLLRFGVVWRALGEDQQRARAIFMGKTNLERVIVRLADPPAAPTGVGEQGEGPTGSGKTTERSRDLASARASLD